MNKLIKKTLLLIPLVKKYVDSSHKIRTNLLENQKCLKELNSLIMASRSPGLFDSNKDFLTERLLAHPVKDPMPSITLVSECATEKPNSVAIADRLIRSYHKALEDEEHSSLKRDGEDLWTGLIRNELPELLETINRKDPEKLAKYLREFGQSFVWFGGITSCVDGYNRNLDPQHVAVTYLDKIICLAEYLGILGFENPESGPWGDNLNVDINDLIFKIEKEIGIEVSPPLGIIHTDGVKAGKGLFHYRHINSLYSAIQIDKLSQQHGPICEFGGGLGMTAMYARRFGIMDYTLLDLPITCLLAGHYLLHAVGDDQVSLYGETLSDDDIKILPYWECLSIPDKSMELIVNQDSLPEISDNLINEYLKQIKRITKKYFLSINHECFHPRTVFNFVRSSTGYDPVSRSKCWVREGYIEEVYRIK